jgi:uncharacterized protein (DUF1810 family)
MTPDPHNLQRFLDAQRLIYPQVCEELRGGQKESHWMWFIFPQVKDLGTSPTAQKYAIQGIDEAKAYLNHPLLGFRLRECNFLRRVEPFARPCARSTTVAQRRDSGPPPGFLARMGLRIRRYVLVARVLGRSIEDIFGYPDHLKFHSCMTLFAHVAAGDKVFTTALTKYFHGELDRKTLKQLSYRGQ